MSDFEKTPLERVAFGIRFRNQFGLEDALGAVIDDILALPDYGPERFVKTVSLATQKQLVTGNNDELITVSGADAIFDTKAGERTADDLRRMANEFVENVWEVVRKHAPKMPLINRYGTLVRFSLPRHWNPIQAMLGGQPAETSEFDLRYARRHVVQEALAVRDVNDYEAAIFHIQTRQSQTTALIDYQRHFSPEIAADKARGDQPFERFVERAAGYFNTAGWEFLSTQIEQHITRAA